MALSDVVVSGVALAKRVLGAGGLMATVQHEAVTSVNAYNEPQYAGPVVNRSAVVEDTNKVLRNQQGHEQVASTEITFLEVVAVDYRDRLTLPDGRTSQIIKIDNGVVGLGGRFVTVVWLG